MNNTKTLSLLNGDQNVLNPWSHVDIPLAKIVLPTNHGFDFLPWTHIIYIKSDGNYTRLYIILGKEILVNMNLSGFEKAVSQHWFIRIHHQYIINIQHLVRYEKGDGGSVTMLHDITLPVSRERKQMFLNKVVKGNKIKSVKSKI